MQADSELFDYLDAPLELTETSELFDCLENYLDGLDSIYFSLFKENPADKTIEAAHLLFAELRRRMLGAALH